MVEWHTKSTRKPSGGLNRSVNARDKKLFERGGIIAATRMVEAGQTPKNKVLKAMGKKMKVKALRSQFANITEAGSNKSQKWEITTVKQNLANKLFVRRNIITKNAILEVKNASQTGYARVTSRPGQSGSVEAVLLTPEQTKAFEEETQKKTAKRAPIEKKTIEPKKPEAEEGSLPARPEKKAKKEKPNKDDKNKKSK